MHRFTSFLVPASIRNLKSFSHFNNNTRLISQSTCTLAPSGRDTDIKWMKVALREASSARLRGEVPIGAVIVGKDDMLLGASGNNVESDRDATSHAEMIALRAASKSMDAWRLIGTTLYCTIEPCAMCLSAAALARVSRIVYGAPDLRLGACGSWLSLHAEKHPYHQFEEVYGGILEDECAIALREFFRERRKMPRVQRENYVEQRMETGGRCCHHG